MFGWCLQVDSNMDFRALIVNKYPHNTFKNSVERGCQPLFLGFNFGPGKFQNQNDEVDFSSCGLISLEGSPGDARSGMLPQL